VAYLAFPAFDAFALIVCSVNKLNHSGITK
jgi:hypothetical protein